jgi:GT2 family glycosyltransferase
MKISVVLPNWNGRKQLEENLPFVLKEKPAEVLIVDDASTDESVNFIKSNFPQIKLLQNSTNRNFAFTVNRGVKEASNELVCILNTDVRPHPGYLKNSFKYFEDKTVFGISLHEVGSGPSVAQFTDGFIGYKAGHEEISVQPSFWVSGGSSIIRKDVWNKLDGFDEKNFPYYWEDLDISYRAAKRGYKLLWVPDCTVEHRHETFYNNKYPSKVLARQKEKRQLVFMWKNITDPKLTSQHIKGLIQRVVKTPGYIRIIVPVFINLPSILALRAVEKRESTTNDSQVIKIGGGGNSFQ